MNESSFGLGQDRYDLSYFEGFSGIESSELIKIQNEYIEISHVDLQVEAINKERGHIKIKVTNGSVLDIFLVGYICRLIEELGDYESAKLSVKRRKDFSKVENIFIIGGGLSGLSTAYFLKKKGIPFTLLEKEDRFGGVIQSFKNEQQVWDKAAVSFSMTPEIQEIITDLGLENELVQAAETSNARYIFRRAKLRKLTSSPSSIFKSPLLSIRGKLKLILESRNTSRTYAKESVADFVSRRFGREMYESVANPVLSGIYAGDPERMEAAVVLKQFVEYEKEFGSIIKGFKANKGKNKRIISSFKQGTGVLLVAMYESVKEHCVSGVEIKDVKKVGEGYEICTAKGDQYEAGAIISCVPAYASAEIFKNLSSSVEQTLKQIPYYKLDMTHLTYKKSDIKGKIEGFGFLFPEVEKKPLLGVVINSCAFDNRAAEDEMTFTAFSKPGLGHTSELAQKEIEKLLNIGAEPTFKRVTHWPKAIPQFEIGHSEIVQRIADFEKNEFITISGNFRSGVSVGDCVKFAKKISQ